MFGSAFQGEQRLPLGHHALLGHQPLRHAAALLGADGDVHFHSLDNGDLGVGLDQVADLHQASDHLPAIGDVIDMAMRAPFRLAPRLY